MISESEPPKNRFTSNCACIHYCNLSSYQSFTSCLKNIWICRAVFLTCLLAAAAVLGWAANHFQTDSEYQLGVSKFEAIADRALVAAKDTLFRRRSGTATVSALYGNLFPEESQWPFVSIERYNEIAREVSFTSSGYSGEEESGQSIGVAHFLSLDQIEEFNNFQADYLHRYFPPARPVYKFPPFIQADGSVATLSPSAYNISAPFTQIYGPRETNAYAMLDLFSTPLYRPSIDQHLQISDDAMINERERNCGIYTHPLRLPSESGPVSHYTHPIYPAKSQSKVVGMSVSPVRWILVLRDLFSAEISGIDCVLESGVGNYHTFSIVRGQPVYKGAGDLHEPQREGLSATLTENFSLCENRTVEYRLSFYPTAMFYDAFSTSNPTIATVGAVMTILFTSCLFLVYDWAVQRDMQEKKTIIQAKRTFMRFVSHEVRTPLNTVSMGLKVIREDVEAMLHRTEQCEEANDIVLVERQKANDIIALTDQISSTAESAVEILSDVLSYDKIENGKLTLELTSVSVFDLLERIVGEFRTPYEAKNVTLLYNGEGEESSDRKEIGDAVRLAQVIRNLLSNALKFTPNGGKVEIDAKRSPPGDASDIEEEIQVKLSDSLEPCFCTRGGVVTVDVIDSGVGMTKDQVKNVFGQGVQFNANTLQDGKGSGLGLYIAKGIVDQHGGSLVASSPGTKCGSTFTMTLPTYIVYGRRKMTQELPESPEETVEFAAKETECIMETSSKTSSANHYSALIVDDAPMNRKLLSRLLQNRGWRCDEAEDGQIAVDKVKASLKAEAPYNCILLDYEMPNMNGPETAKCIRAMGCDTSIVGVTGNVLPEDVQHFIRCGVSAVFSKPVQLHALETFWRENGLLKGDLLQNDESMV